MKVSEVSTSTLRAMDRWLDELPFFVMKRLRTAIKTELLVRDLERLADDTGGFLCCTVRGVQ